MSKTRNPDALIRIEDAIKVLCRKYCCLGPFCPDGYCVEMWDEFEDVERVDAVPVVHGEWIDKDGGIATCSVCGDRWGVWSVMKYCPNCGAKMNEEDNEQKKQF